MEEHGGSELSGLSGQWFILSGIGVGRENVMGVHRRWLVKRHSLILQMKLWGPQG